MFLEYINRLEIISKKLAYLQTKFFEAWNRFRYDYDLLRLQIVSYGRVQDSVVINYQYCSSSKVNILAPCSSGLGKATLNVFLPKIPAQAAEWLYGL